MSSSLEPCSSKLQHNLTWNCFMSSIAPVMPTFSVSSSLSLDKILKAMMAQMIINCDATEFKIVRQVVSGVGIEKLDNLSLSSGAFLAALIAQLRNTSVTQWWGKGDKGILHKKYRCTLKLNMYSWYQKNHIIMRKEDKDRNCLTRNIDTLRN